MPGEDFGRGAINIQYNRNGFLGTPDFIQPKHPSGDGYTLGSRFGAALACGDFDGDGDDDLAVGAPFTAAGGDVWVYWARPGIGLSADTYGVFHQNADGVPGSGRTGETFGLTLVVADFNRDGIRDLAVGDPEEPDPRSGEAQGTVIIVPGRTINFAREGFQQLWGWVDHKSNEVPHQKFGWSLAAGPLVSGGGDDLVVGAPFTRVSDKSSAGRAYLFRDHGGLVPQQVIDEAALAASGGLAGPLVAPADDALFGWAIETGDFNHDGMTDLAVGAPGKVGTRGLESGVAVMLPGDSVGADLSGYVYLEQEALGGFSEKFDRYGWSLTSGDWNEDGFDDLAVGAPFKTIKSPNGTVIGAYAGAVYVHQGGAALVNGLGMVLRQGSGTTPGTPQFADGFGVSLATTRLGPTNSLYLAIGIPGEPFATLTPECSQAGAIQLARSWPALGPLTDPTFWLHQDTAGPFNVAEQRECTTAASPIPFTISEPARTGEFFGWAVGS